MMEHTNELSKRKLFSSLIALVLAIGLMIPVASAYAEPTAAQKKAEAKEALDKFNELQAQLDEASDNYTDALLKQEEAEKKVDEAQQQIEKETEKIKGLQEQLGDRARDMYRGGMTSFLDIILGATSFDEFANGWFMMDTINQNDAELVQETKAARESLEAAKAEYVEQEKVARDEANRAKEVKDNAEALSVQAKETYDNLSAEARELQEQEEREAAEAARIAAETNNSNNYFGNENSGGGSNTSNSGSTSNNTYTTNKPADDGTVVGRAYSQLGKPYKWAAVGPNSFDCSGFVSYCLTGRNVRLGSTGDFIGWPRVSNPQPGDICVKHAGKSGHCGIYIGNGQMIHAPRTGDVVKISGVQPGMIFVRY